MNGSELRTTCIAKEESEQQRWQNWFSSSWLGKGSLQEGVCLKKSRWWPPRGGQILLLLMYIATNSSGFHFDLFLSPSISCRHPYWDKVEGKIGFPSRILMQGHNNHFHLKGQALWGSGSQGILWQEKWSHNFSQCSDLQLKSTALAFFSSF